MVSLVDIVPQKRRVQIAVYDEDGVPTGESAVLELRGLGLRQIADLFLTFQGLRNIFTEGAPALSPTEIIDRAPDAIGTIIALAAGQPEAAEKIVDVGGGLTPDEIGDCLEAIYELTFPRGVTPFLLRLAPFMGLVADVPSGGDPDMNVPPAPNGSLPADTTLVQ
jgi:hypothetical protein